MPSQYWTGGWPGSHDASVRVERSIGARFRRRSPWPRPPLPPTASCCRFLAYTPRHCGRFLRIFSLLHFVIVEPTFQRRMFQLKTVHFRDIENNRQTVAWHTVLSPMLVSDGYVPQRAEHAL